MLDARVPSLGGNAAQNSLEAYGLGFGNLNVLNEHGLIIADYNSWFDDRKQASLDAYFATVPPDQLARIEAIAMDMWEPYVQSVLAHVPNGQMKIVFDKYHIISNVHKPPHPRSFKRPAYPYPLHVSEPLLGSDSYKPPQAKQ